MAALTEDDVRTIADYATIALDEGHSMQVECPVCL